MGSCSYLNQEKSGPVNGCYCGVIGGYVEQDFRTCYCTREVACQYCPHRGGDDRIRNPEALTEEICESIQSSVSRNLDYGKQYVCQSLRQLQETAAQTGYDYLGQMIYEAALTHITTPSVSGEFVSVVLTEVEKKRARTLEENLDGMFAEFQPCEYACGAGSGGIPDISGSVFQQMSSEATGYGSSASSLIQKRVDAGGISKYEDIVSRALETLGDRILYYFSVVSQGISEAGTVFDSGCSSTFSGMGAFDTYTGEGPGWFS